MMLDANVSVNSCSFTHLADTASVFFGIAFLAPGDYKSIIQSPVSFILIS